MKLSLIVFLLSQCVFAQTASVKDIPSDQEGTTTISITKGDKKNPTDEYQITEGTATIAGEPELLAKQARSSWKKECAEWKKELKELNAGNQVLVMNCNQPRCEKNGMSESVCTSEANYKLKVKVK